MAAEAVIETQNKTPINRREFLNLAWLVSLGFFTISIGGVTYLFSMPRFREGEFGGIFNMGEVGSLPPPGSEPMKVPEGKLWLSNTERGVLAIYTVCTHLGCLYNWESQQDTFRCPCHGSAFEPDGTFIEGPAPRSLDRFAILIESRDGQILAQTDPETGDPVPLPDDPTAMVRVDTGRRILGPPRT
jgi:cytochrome b6-f complex iron-sulfur subunit